MSVGGLLVVMPALKAFVKEDGKVVLTQKFLDGALEFLASWKGPMRVVMEGSPAPSNSLDNIDVFPKDLPFELEVEPFSSPDLASKLKDASVVLGTVSYRQNHLAQVCAQIGAACVYMTEYTLVTRIQIIDAELQNPMLRAWKVWTEKSQEKKQQRAIRNSAGIQCNGTPTFEAYKTINDNAFLFFDTRARGDMLITDDELARRVAYIRGKKKLRLAFSGRLDHMKGAEYLPAIAAALRERKVDFELVICGGGPLEDQIKNDLERLSLGDAVKMKGVLEFKSELMPYMKNGVDLFVLSHVQGDPACTYLETLSCGVPIVGFDNEAFVGILEHADVGWTVPMRDIEKMADTIAHLDANRDELAGAALRSLTFARVHTFEETFRLRTVHLLECCERQTAVKKS